MKHNALLLLLVFAMVSSCIYVSKDGDQREKDAKPEIEGTITDQNGNQTEVDNLEDAVNALTDALSGVQDSEPVEAIDFQELKKMLPERLAGMKRVSHEGERSGVGNMKFSSAQARYEDGDARLEVSIIDGGGFAGFIAGMAAWSMVEVDRETEDGYERTTMIDGYKAYEKYDNRSQGGQISLIIQDRLIVNVEGDNLSERQLKRALESLNLDRLKRAI